MFQVHEALMETNETSSVYIVLNIQIDYLILVSKLILNKSGSIFFGLRCGMMTISVTLPHKKHIQINTLYVRHVQPVSPSAVIFIELHLCRTSE